MQKSNWQPTASITTLKARAKIIADIRHFFAKRNVLEVDTPSLSQATVTDPYLHSIPAHCSNGKTLYLQTSPEFHMKRLLAAGSGCIYQICKSFRDEEYGHQHNPEFTMLEWYRIGFTHHDLMDEMDDLLQTILQCSPAERYTYAELFETHLHINPHQASLAELEHCAATYNLQDIPGMDKQDKDLWLQLLMSTVIEPKLIAPSFVYDYPASQAALAKITTSNPPVAERFEVYIQGVELANGFHELSDAEEQRKRFTQDLQKRKTLGYKQPPIDENLLAALAHGLPHCSGVALGIDRLIMLALQKDDISNILSFNIQNA